MSYANYNNHENEVTRSAARRAAAIAARKRKSLPVTRVIKWAVMLVAVAVVYSFVRSAI